jgi:hypothetical protein
MRLFSRRSDCASLSVTIRLHVGDVTPQDAQLGGHVGVGREVAAHPRTESLRLAHVEHGTVGVLPEVDAGAIGERIELALEGVALLHRARAGRTSHA